MEKTKEEFAIFISQAINSKNSVASQELYNFLAACFVRADIRLEGKVCLDRFDSLVEEATVLPKKFGFAPSNEDLYTSEGMRKAARTKLFNDIDKSKAGFIKLDQWISWSTDYIAANKQRLSKDYLRGNADDVSVEEFVAFVKRAIYKDTPEYRQLYYFLLQCFQECGAGQFGTVDYVAFDRMIEAAAAAPRRYGLAPKSEVLFETPAARLAKRKEYFSDMDKNDNGFITFDEWLDFAYRHIVLQVFATLF